MNQNKQFYHQFKHNWHLLLKINSTPYFYSKCFKKYISQRKIINFLLALDPELKAANDFYPTIKQTIKIYNFETFHQAIQHTSDLLLTEMKTAFKTLTNYQDYVENTMVIPDTNGVPESMNNKIKVIKGIAFRYRSFYHFKARILIIHKFTFKPKIKGIKPLKEQLNSSRLLL